MAVPTKNPAETQRSASVAIEVILRWSSGSSFFALVPVVSRNRISATEPIRKMTSGTTIQPWPPRMATNEMTAEWAPHTIQG